MTTTARVQIYRVAALYEPPSRWLQPGVLIVVDGRVAGVGTDLKQTLDSLTRPLPVQGALDLPPVNDFPDAVLVPAFTDAHCHLDLSGVAGPLPRAADQQDFPAWLLQVIEYRQQHQLDQAAILAAVDRAIQEKVQHGTSLIGDILSLTSPAEVTLRCTVAGLSGWSFLEMIGLRQDRYEMLWQQLQTRLTPVVSSLLPETTAVPLAAAVPTVQPEASNEIVATRAGQMQLGVSPHAPYSTAVAVYQRAQKFCRQQPVATHWLECPAERDLLTSGSGRLRPFLESLGAWPADPCFPIPQTASATSFWPTLLGEPAATDTTAAVPPEAEALGGWLLIHGNQIQPEEYDYLQSCVQTGQVRGVVYCPRSHAYFGFPPHPWRELQSRGIPVALGTDSRASNPDGIVWNEARFLAAQGHPPDLLLQMLTQTGAQLLGLAADFGSLTPGKWAHAVLIRPGSNSGSDMSTGTSTASSPTAWAKCILAPDAQIQLVLQAGQQIPASG